MKSNKKIFVILASIGIGLLLLGAVLIAVFVLKKNSAADGIVTRYEWMAMLGERFGITEYSDPSPYFQDVKGDSPYFNYVQSAVEWGVLEEENRFHGEQTATGEFIVLTTMRAIGKYKIQLYLEMNEEPDRADYLDVAYANGLITEDKLDTGFDREECLMFLDAAQNLNDLTLWKDDLAIVTYQENVIELEAENVSLNQAETNEVWLDASALEGLSAGDVLIFEMGNTELKTARRVESIDASSGLVTVSEPTMEEVFDSLIISDMVSLSGEDIANYYHLGNAYFGTYENVLSGTGSRKDYQVLPMGTLSGEVQSAGVAFSVASEDNKIKIKATNNDTGESVEVTLDMKLDDDTQVECSFEITNIDVAAQAIWRWSTLEYADVQLYTEIVEKVNLNIVSEEMEIPLGEIPIPIVYGLASVNLQLSLVISAEGSISIEARTPVGAHITYEKGKDIRWVNASYNYPEPKIEVSAEVGIMLRPEATLTILVLWDAVDVQCDVGVKVGASAATNGTQICTEVFIAFPVMSLEVTVDPLFVSALSKEWELIAKENAPFRWNRHFEIYADGTSGFVEACTYESSHALFGASEESTPPQSGQEKTEFARYSTYSLPIRLQINSPFEDAGEYYTVTGRLTINYTIDTAEFDELQEGDTFMVQDKQFVKGSMLTADDYPDYVYLNTAYLPQLYPLYCAEDDHTYYIDTRFRLDWGSRYGLEYYSLLYDNPVLLAGSDEGMAAWQVVQNDIGEVELIIAKGAYITSIGQEEVYTAEDCYNNHIAIGVDGYDLPTLSVGGNRWETIDCYITFDANGMIDYIGIPEFF